jgi:hypothetical protein
MSPPLSDERPTYYRGRLTWSPPEIQFSTLFDLWIQLLCFLSGSNQKTALMFR